MRIRTVDLEPGDCVWVCGRIRTVAETMVPTGYANTRNEPIYAVLYMEGSTVDWHSHGNAALKNDMWEVVHGPAPKTEPDHVAVSMHAQGVHDHCNRWTCGHWQRSADWVHPLSDGAGPTGGAAQ